MLRYKTKTRPGLVALYDIRPGNGAGPFLQPGARTGLFRIVSGAISSELALPFTSTNTATNPHTDRTDYNTLCRSFASAQHNERCKWWTQQSSFSNSPTGVSWWSTSTAVCCTACTGVSSVNHTIAASSSASPAQFLIVSCSVHTQGRSQYEARRGNCLVLFSSATNFCTFVPR